MKGKKTMEKIARDMLENSVNASLSALQAFGKRIEDLSQAQEDEKRE